MHRISPLPPAGEGRPSDRCALRTGQEYGRGGGICSFQGDGLMSSGTRHSRPQAFARHLRKNMTDAERHLWQHLRHKQLHGIKFRRQQSIGTYIVDFVSMEHRLVLELDGSQHMEQVAHDA